MNKLDIWNYLQLQQNDIDDAIAEINLIEEILAEPNPTNLSDAKIGAIYAGIALHIQSFYTAIEMVLKNTLNKIDGVVPDGDAWHAQLLKQASRSNDHRNALISKVTFEGLNELRGFRHIVRNLYGSPLKRDRVSEIAEIAQSLKSSFIQDWNSFKSNFESKNEHNSQTETISDQKKHKF